MAEIKKLFEFTKDKNEDLSFKEQIKNDSRDVILKEEERELFSKLIYWIKAHSTGDYSRGNWNPMEMEKIEQTYCKVEVPIGESLEVFTLSRFTDLYTDVIYSKILAEDGTIVKVIPKRKLSSNPNDSLKARWGLGSMKDRTDCEHYDEKEVVINIQN